MKNPKCGVQVRVEDGEELPCVCVKPSPLYHRAPADVQNAPEAVRDAAYECVAEDWWWFAAPAAAEDYLRLAFKETTFVTTPAGRSSGWLVVRGLPPVAEWSERQRRAWGEVHGADRGEHSGCGAILVGGRALALAR